MVPYWEGGCCGRCQGGGGGIFARIWARYGEIMWQKRGYLAESGQIVSEDGLSSKHVVRPARGQNGHLCGRDRTAPANYRV